MRNRRKKIKETNNSRVYKMTKRNVELGCIICSPNKGCNRRAKKIQRNWKRFRNSQWK